MLNPDDDPTEWIAAHLPNVSYQIDICGIAPSQLALLVTQTAAETADILADYA